MNTIDSIRKALEAGKTSEAIREALRLATRAGQTELARWYRLELGGYVASNSAMSEDVIVPDYRSVVGQHRDLYGHLFAPGPDLEFINETRLRNGVEELEQLACSKDTVSIHDPHLCQIIRDNLNVEVYSFTFSSTHVVGILSAIRSEFEDRLAQSLPIAERDADSEEEVLILRPNFYGIGLNLRSLWRRMSGK